MPQILFTIEGGTVKSHLEGFKGLECNQEALGINGALQALGLDVDLTGFTQTDGTRDQKVAIQTGTQEA